MQHRLSRGRPAALALDGFPTLQACSKVAHQYPTQQNIRAHIWQSNPSLHPCFIVAHLWWHLRRRRSHLILRAQSTVPDQLDWGRMSRADRDLAYNNGAAVPDSAQIMERIIAASTNLRAQRSRHIDVPYGEGARNK
jgi:hypothetical protein